MINVPWLVKNMIGESVETTKLRQPSEIEIKVQKSLQKLTIPDWYVNKSRESPKIISDRRPIEIRPAPWKEYNYQKNRQQFSKNHRCDDPTEKTEIVGPVIFGNEEEEKEKEKEKEKEESFKSSSKESKLSKKSENFFKRGIEISQTFPRISPSRKIQNINIVFPTSKSPISEISEKTIILDSTDDEKILKKFTNNYLTSIKIEDNKNEIINEEDYLIEFSPEKMSTFKNDEIFNKNLENSFVKTTAARILTYDNESPKDYERNNYLDINDDNTELENEKNFENVDNNYRLKNFVKKIDYFESRKFSNDDNDEKKTSQKLFENNFTPKSLKNFCQKKYENEEYKNDEKYDNIELFKTPKKSTEMENIIKKINNQRKRSSGGKSFVEEIIEELNSKCSPKVKTNNENHLTSSPGKKNFVKKLVRELEMGCFTENNNNKNKNRSGLFKDDNNLSINIENNSSINFEKKYFSKYNENELCDIKQKTNSLRSSLCSSPFRNFSRALEDRESVRAYVDDDDESVFWIPLPICRLPRTSSLKNVTTTTTDNNLTNIRQEICEKENIKFGSSVSGWGKTFNKGKKRRTRGLFRIDETTVGDSGYSDRSETNSSRSSSIVGEESWYSESETTRTASEDSDNGFDCYFYFDNNNFEKNRFYRSKQRTSVV